MRNSRPHTHTTVAHARMYTTIMIMLQLYLRRGESFGLATKFIYIHKLLFSVHLLLLLLSSSIFLTLATLHIHIFSMFSLSLSLPFVFEFPSMYSQESTWKFTTICEFIYHQHLWNVSQRERESGKNYDMHTRAKAPRKMHLDRLVAFYFAHFALHHSGADEQAVGWLVGRSVGRYTFCAYISP